MAPTKALPPQSKLRSRIPNANFPRKTFKAVRACRWIGDQGALLLQYHLAVGVFEPLQLRQERQAEQVFRQRRVGQHHGVDVAHHQSADIDHRKPGARRLDGSVVTVAL